MAITAPGALTYTPPNRPTQTPTVFSSNANDTVTQLKTFSTEMVTAVGQLNTDIGDVNTNAADIIASGTAAVAAANFQGNWADLTGAFTVGYSVKHDGLLWIANTAIADVTADEPGVSGDWDQVGGTVRETRTANIQIVAIDYGKIIDYTSGTFSQTFAPAANLGEGWAITLANNGAGIITLDPDSAETINGAATIDLLPGQVTIVTGNGTALFATFLNDGNVMVREARTSNTILDENDNGVLIDYTTGGFTQTFTAAASLYNGWHVRLQNSSSGEVTLDPNGSETIDGITSFKMYPNEVRDIYFDGTNFYSIVQSGFRVRFTSSGTFTKPSGYSKFLVEGIGGGASGGADTSDGAGGGGGGSRYIKELSYDIVGATESVTVGAGASGVSGPANGSAGGNSSFGSLLTAYGGAGGMTSNSAGGGGGGNFSAGDSSGTSIGGGFGGGAAGANSAGSDATDIHGGGGGGSGTGGHDGGAGYNGGAGGASGATGANNGGAGGSSLFGPGAGGGGGDTGAAGAGGTTSTLTAGGGGAAGSGANGGDGTSRDWGMGDGGGGADATFNGGAGGTPGGGGGGAGKNGTSGAGGDGEVRIWGIV